MGRGRKVAFSMAARQSVGTTSKPAAGTATMRPFLNFLLTGVDGL